MNGRRAASTPARVRADRRRNRRSWDRSAADYERRHARALRAAGGASWGMYRIPERRLNLLGKVRGLRTLELGCGSATWSMALARRGAYVVGIDPSAERVRQAIRNARGSRTRVRVVRAEAEHLPFGDGAFDLVFCDWGAMTFADPDHTVPEAARVLREGGRFVFSTSTPFRTVAQPRGRGSIGARLRYPYFGLGRIVLPEGVEHQRTYGAWIGIFRANGLAIERLEEPQRPPGARSTYLDRAEAEWARRWPVEAIWSLRKEPGAPGTR